MSESSGAPAAAGAVLLVSDQAGLEAALAGARGGETILLAPGVYSGFALRGRDFPETLTVASADPADRAVIDGTISLRSVSGLRIEALDIAGSAPLSPGAARLSADGVADLALVGLRVAGALHGGEGPHSAAALAADPQLGWPCEFGVRIANAAGVLIEGAEFSILHKAVKLTGVTGAVISGSEFRDLRSDGIALSDAAAILIEDNYFHDFHPLRNYETGEGDHPDFIQFFGNASGGVEGLTIRDNVFLQGGGGVVQAIFGHAGVAAGATFRDFEISGNFIQTNHSAGIGLGDVIGARIFDNVLIPSGQPMHAAASGWRPAIRLAGGEEGGAPRDIEIRDNLATLGWSPIFNPSGLDAAANEARGIVYGPMTFLDRGKAVPDWWAAIALPDRTAFADMAAWREAALDALRAAVPPEVAALLPAPRPAGLRLVAGPGDGGLEGGAALLYRGGAGADLFLVDSAGPGGGAILDLDLAAGDRLQFGADRIDGVESLLALALAGRLSLTAEGALRLTGAEGAALDLFPAEPLTDLSGALPARIETVAGAAALLGPGLSGFAADEAGRLHAVRDGVLDAAATATPGLLRLAVAAHDGAGGFAFGATALLIRPDAAPTHIGGPGDDTIRTANAAAFVLAGAGDDAVLGRAGDDWIEGGAGADRIAGGGGSDTMAGGAGADQFRFEAADFAGGERDLILDLDFAEGDSLALTRFAPETFEAPGWLAQFGGANLQIRSAEALVALDAAEGFALRRLGEGRVEIALALPDGREAAIELILAGATAARFEALWPEV